MGMSAVQWRSFGFLCCGYFVSRVLRDGYFAFRGLRGVFFAPRRFVLVGGLYFSFGFGRFFVWLFWL
jgi:hypothetical protein